MKTRTFGSTELQLSELGMGCIQITRLEWQESVRVVRSVMDLGVNWFDTARSYFDSELRLADAFAGRRQEIILMSKSGAQEAHKLEQQLNESLQRLRTDYLDVFLFHGGSALLEEGCAAPGGVLEVAQRAVEAGKVRYLGFSAHRVDTSLKALERGVCSMAMVPANFISREYIDGAFMERAREQKVAVAAMKPFGGGRIDNASLCLKYLRQYSELFPCIGIEHAREMEQNIAAWEADEPFSEKDRADMAHIQDLLGERFCRGCAYCMPCPEGISIPTVTFVDVIAKQMPKDKVVTQQRSESIETAKQCTECRQCVERCPYDLDIPAMIKQNVAFYQEFASG